MPMRASFKPMRSLLAGSALLLICECACADEALPLSGMNILVLGESHMVIYNHLIATLPDELVRLGAHVYAYGACGASAADWLRVRPVSCSASRIDDGTIRERPADIASTQLASALIEKHHPNLVMVIIGDTMAGYGKKQISKSWVWQEVSALTKAIDSQQVRCVWVGPTWGEDGGEYKKTNARAKEFSDYLSTIVAPCAYIDSLKFSQIGEWKTTDGQHLDRWGYANWAHAIAGALTSSEILQQIKR